MLRVGGDEAAQDDADGRSVLDEIAREGARRMLVAALETEVAAYLEAHAAERDADGHALVVRNGKARTRRVTVGSGTIAVSAPRVNDRRTDTNGQRCKFTSRILPPYMRRSPKVAEVLPVLYLREGGERHVLNYALRGDTIVADRVLHKAVVVVRTGDDERTVEIENRVPAKRQEGKQ